MANCAKCCDTAVDLGCFDPCAAMVLEQEADVTGVHTLVLGYLGNTVKIESAQVIGEPLTFPISGLNESFTFTGVMTDPDGDEVSFGGCNSCGQPSGCIKFETAKVYSIE